MDKTINKKQAARIMKTRLSTFVRKYSPLLQNVGLGKEKEFSLAEVNRLKLQVISQKLKKSIIL